VEFPVDGEHFCILLEFLLVCEDVSLVVGAVLKDEVAIGITVDVCM